MSVASSGSCWASDSDSDWDESGLGLTDADSSTDCEKSKGDLPRCQMMPTLRSGGGPDQSKASAQVKKTEYPMHPVEWVDSLEFCKFANNSPVDQQDAKPKSQMVQQWDFNSTSSKEEEQSELETQSETEDTEANQNRRISDWITHGRLSLLFAGSGAAKYQKDYNNVGSLFPHSQEKEDTDVSSLDSTQDFSNDNVVVRRMTHAKQIERQKKQQPKSRRILKAKRAAAGQPDVDQKQDQWRVRERSSLTKRAGLVFPARESERHLKAQGYRVAVHASVYLSAVLEYLCEEMLLLGAENTRQNKRKCMQTKHIQRAIKHDTEIQEMLHRLMQN